MTPGKNRWIRFSVSLCPLTMLSCCSFCLSSCCCKSHTRLRWVLAVSSARSLSVLISSRLSASSDSSLLVLLPVNRLARLLRASLRLASRWDFASAASCNAVSFSFLAVSASLAQVVRSSISLDLSASISAISFAIFFLSASNASFSVVNDILVAVREEFDFTSSDFRFSSSSFCLVISALAALVSAKVLSIQRLPRSSSFFRFSKDWVSVSSCLFSEERMATSCSRPFFLIWH